MYAVVEPERPEIFQHGLPLGHGPIFECLNGGSCCIGLA